ncbi:unnamed protein product, partial [Protopolystoma xenopodis]
LKERASQWLCEFQRSVIIQCYFTELPASSHEALKDSLLEHVREMSEETQLPIANQLCLAVADLFCHMVQWSNGISNIINSNKLRLGLNRRHALLAEFESSKELIIKFLSYKVASASESELARIFNCLASWLDNSCVLTENDVSVSPLLEAAFFLLRNPMNTSESAYESATQFVLALLYQGRKFDAEGSKLISWLQSNVYQLTEVLVRCANAMAASHSVSGLGRQEHEQQVSKLSDPCSCIAQIIDELSRALKRHIVGKPSPVGSGALGDLRSMESLITVLELPAPIGTRELIVNVFSSLQNIADDAIKVPA